MFFCGEPFLRKKVPRTSPKTFSDKYITKLGKKDSTMQNTLTKERALLYSLLRSALKGEELPPGVSLRELIILRFRAY